MRSRVEHEPGDHCVTRPRTRTVSSVVDAQTAALLTHFRTPTTILDAVIAFSSAAIVDPQDTLDAAFGALATLLEEGLLVPATSKLAQPIAPSLPTGALVDGVEVLALAHLLDDTEVYRGRTSDGTAVALKIVGTAAGRHAIAAIHHEGEVLKLLDGRVNPRLMLTGFLGERPFLVTAWHLGVDLYQAANDLRSMPRPEARDGILEIAKRILEAYAHLHAQGVLHGDVQPRNVIVDALGEITVVDYGLAAVPDGGMVYMRGGIDTFHAPEVAHARLLADEIPATSSASEQYSLAALLYFLLTGSHTHAFSLQQEEMLRQVLEDPPLPFSRHGITDLGAAERCLRRGLAKDPARRHRSVANLHQAFRAAAKRDRARPQTAFSHIGAGRDPAGDLLEEVLKRIEAPGPLFARGLEPPTASVTYGGAGIAYALLRIARTRDDENLLAQADLWATRAALSLENDDAFWNRDLDITPETFGRASLFHHASGVHCVESLIAQALGDDRAQLLAIDRFIAACDECEYLDLAFGRSGLLLGCAILLEAFPGHLDSSSMRSLGERLLCSIVSELRTQPPIAESAQTTTLGAAHGWSGYLFAILRWCEASDIPPPVEVRGRLEELAMLGKPCGRGLTWPRHVDALIEDALLAASWCNGAAGHVHLWTLADRHWNDAGFNRLAELAAFTTYETAPEAPGELCCGLAGRAYALLCRYKQTGERRWLARARMLGQRAAARPGVPKRRLSSLYHGEVGIALLASDLDDPDFACMPLFEAEGWPVATSTSRASGY